MIDIHTHLLPGIDDGPDDKNETIDILSKSSKEGIKKIIATPHFNDDSKFSKDYIIKEVARFNEIAKLNNIDIRIYSGAEYQMSSNLSKFIDNNGALTLANSRYILVEFPFNGIPIDSKNILNDLQLMGYTPIIAHPERCSDIIDKPSILYNYVDKGIYAQLNAGSIIGRYGHGIKKTAITLIKNNLVQLIASDLHSIGRRNQLLPEALEVVRKIDPNLSNIFYKNAENIIENRKFIVPEYKESSSGFFSWTNFLLV